MPGIFARKFHQKISGMIRSLPIPFNDQYWPWEWKTIFFKSYPLAENIPLPRPEVPPLNFIDILKGRETFRDFSPEGSMTAQELGTILYYGVGIRNPPADHKKGDWNLTFRFYPSGGGRYPIEVYCALRNVEGVPPGIYHYAIKEHALEKIAGEQALETFITDGLSYPWSKNAPAFIVMTSVWERTLAKYKDLGYKLVLLEAGHISQNLLLLATSLGVGSCPLAGFYADVIDDILNLPALEESMIHLCAFGR